MGPCALMTANQDRGQCKDRLDLHVIMSFWNYIAMNETQKCCKCTVMPISVWRITRQRSSYPTYISRIKLNINEECFPA